MDKDKKPVIKLFADGELVKEYDGNHSIHLDINNMIDTIQSYHCTMSIAIYLLKSDQSVEKVKLHNIEFINFPIKSKAGFAGVFETKDSRRFQTGGVICFDIEMENTHSQTIIITKYNGDVDTYEHFTPIKMNAEALSFNCVDSVGKSQTVYIPMKNVEEYKIVNN